MKQNPRVDGRPSHVAIAVRDIKRVISDLYAALASAQRLMQQDLFLEVTEKGKHDGIPQGSADNPPEQRRKAHQSPGVRQAHGPSAKRGTVANNPDRGRDPADGAGSDRNETGPRA